jgi:hypothetical protein
MRRSGGMQANVERHRQPAHSVHPGGQRRSYRAGVQDRSSHIRAMIDAGQDQVRCRVQPAADRCEHDVTGLCVDCVRFDAGKIGQLASLDQSLAVLGGRDDARAGAAGLPHGCGDYDVETSLDRCGCQRDQAWGVDAVIIDHHGLA